MANQIRKIRKAKDVTLEDLSEFTGISPGHLQRMETGQRGLSLENVLKIAKALGVEPVELTDEFDHEQLAAAAAMPLGSIIGGNSRDNDEVRELYARAGAGGGGTFDLINVTDEHDNQISADVVKDHWRIPTSFLQGELRLEASKAVMIEVTGDSGYDPNNPHAPGSVFPGDRVIVNGLDTRPTPPGPFLVYDGTGFVVKLCEPVHGSDPPAIRLASRNPNYTPYNITLDDGHIIVGRVVGRFTRM
jgi:transcriptional regulator with XRE-family HTH domain